MDPILVLRDGGEADGDSSMEFRGNESCMIVFSNWDDAGGAPALAWADSNFFVSASGRAIPVRRARSALVHGLGEIIALHSRSRVVTLTFDL